MPSMVSVTRSSGGTARPPEVVPSVVTVMRSPPGCLGCQPTRWNGPGRTDSRVR
jgi:hypothetical protein